MEKRFSIIVVLTTLIFGFACFSSVRADFGNPESTCASMTLIDTGDCTTLLHMYNQLGGDNWTHKDGRGTDSTGWYGIVFSTGAGGYTGKVSSINLSSNNLSGNITSGTFAALRSMDISKNNIIGFSEGIFSGMSLLKNLDMSENNISIIPDNAFTELGVLSTLNLSGNQLNSIGNYAFNKLYTLLSLDISSQNIQTIGNNAFNELYGLSSINLSNNNIVSLSSGLFMRSAGVYQTINLSNNKIAIINSGVFGGSNLSGIDLSNNEIEVIGDHAFNVMRNLKVLNFSGNKITTIGEYAFKELGVLPCIDLSNQNIINLSRGSFTNDAGWSQTINLSNNKIVIISSGVFIGSNMSGIDLSNNEIEVIGDYAFNNMNSLKNINFSGNKITTIGDYAFADMHGLEGIDLSNNPISSLGSHAFSNLSISYLNLSGNKLTTINSYAFDTLTSLKYFNLNGTGIDTIKGFGFNILPGLKTLSLKGHRIATLEDKAFNIFPSLTGLDLSHNKLTSLNSGRFNALPQLTVLDLSYNNISYIQSGAFYDAESYIKRNLLLYTGGLDINMNKLCDINDLDSTIIEYINDKSGGTGRQESQNCFIDIESPIITGITNGNTYTTSAIFTVSDNVGVASVTLDGNNLTGRTNITITTIGTHTLIAKDASNNTTTISFEVKKSSGGGGGGGSSKDSCPNGDYTASKHDGKCGTGAITTGSTSTGSRLTDITTGNDIIDKIKETIKTIVENVKIPDKEEIKEQITSYKDEEVKEELAIAYQFALANGVTTITNIVDAMLDGVVTREQMAKMITNYMINVLGVTGTKYGEKECSQFSDLGNMDKEMKGYAIVVCQLGLMGQDSNGGLLSKFNPKAEVTRAQFGAVLSRMLRGDKYNRDGGDWYKSHLNMLKRTEIMTDITKPDAKELRGRVILMMQRAGEKIGK